MRWIKSALVALALVVTGAALSAQLPGPPVGAPQANQNLSFGYNFEYTFRPSSTTGGGFRVFPTLALTTSTGNTQDLARIGGTITLANSSTTVTTAAALHVLVPTYTLNSGTITTAATVMIDGDPATGTTKVGLWDKGTMLIGLAGTTQGSIGFQNATSGTVTLAPQTGALGTVTVRLPTVAGSLPIAQSCGASLAAAAACPNTDPAGNLHMTYGTFLLAGNTSTVTGITAYASATSWNCVANDITTRANPVQAIPGSASTVVITNTTGATDLISMICIGN